MDIKAKLEQIVNKLKPDTDLMAKFQKNPVAVVEELIGVDLPDDLVEKLIDGIKVKLAASKVGDALEGLGKLFGK